MRYVFLPCVVGADRLAVLPRRPQPRRRARLRGQQGEGSTTQRSEQLSRKNCSVSRVRKMGDGGWFDEADESDGKSGEEGGLVCAYWLTTTVRLSQDAK